MKNEETSFGDRRESQWLRKPNAEPSLLELSRVATEEDKVNVQPAIYEVNEKMKNYEDWKYRIWRKATVPCPDGGCY